jgi:germination protein M
MIENTRRHRHHSTCRSAAIRLAIPGMALALVLAALPATGCGKGSTTTTTGATAVRTTTTTTPPTTGTSAPVTTTKPPTTVTTAASTTTTTPASLKLNVYFVHGETVAAMRRMVDASGVTTDTERLTGTVQALLAGPKASEKALGTSTAIPAGTKLLGVKVDATSQTATIDLSGDFESGGGSLSMSLRLAQMVYTLTQFDGIQKVQFSLDGTPVTVFGGEGIVLDHPVGRADFEDMTPAILVESVAPGDTVTSPLRVSGTANVFEAAFRVQLLDAQGTKLVDQVVNATSGTGTRGTFSEELPFPVTATGQGKLMVFADSPKDGSPIDVVEIPVTLGK